MVRKRALETNNALSNSTSDTDVPEDSGETNSEANTIQTEAGSFNVEEEFKKLYDKAVKLGLTGEDFAKMEVLKDIGWSGSYVRVTLKYICIVILAVLLLFYVTFMIYLVEWPIGREKILNTWFWWNGENPAEEMCAINMPEFVNDMFRPPVDCDFCENLTAVETVYNISSEEFEDFFGYTGIPVVIGDGTVNWTATEFFSFEFFKEIYKEGSAALDNQMTNCQFFPYKTSFRDLGEVLSMSPERARMEDGSQPWYIGWSNCDFSAANILRKHYQRPYFLPKLSESSKTDWMFMGSPGYGAHMHIDNVGHPSWQAQVTGTKRWTLEPPPECYYTCADSIEVTVHPGQIIVLDTNIWYHSTLNVGQDISITIGSEYD